MTGIAAATTTTDLAVEYLNADSEAFAGGREQFSGVIYASSSWEVHLIRRLLALHERNPERVTPDVLDRAILLVGQISRLQIDGVLEPFVGPVEDGGVIFEWTVGSRQLSLAVLVEGTTRYLQWESSEQFSEDDLPAGFAGRLLELITWLRSTGG
jgi:hypothetical protein